MVLPPLLMLLLGTMSAGVVVYTAASLHYAVEGAARCYSVNSGTCGSATTTQSYAKNIYLGTAVQHSRLPLVVLRVGTQRTQGIKSMQRSMLCSALQWTPDLGPPVKV
jgi:hypothetical protein